MNMIVRPSRGTARPSAQKPKTQQAYTWPAPTRGLIANGNLAASVQGGAYILENFFCTATGIIMRRGKARYATLGAEGKPVRSIFSYLSGNLKKLFAANDDAIYDITVMSSAYNWLLVDQVDDMLVTDEDDTIGMNSTDDLDVLANTTGKWVVVQTQASDGSTYLRGVNGQDTPFVFDGSTFDTAPALTFPSGDTTQPEQLSYVWTHKNRMFFIQKESLDAWYLPVGQIGGELAKFSLGGQFKLGGYLVMGATWSRDTGSGLNAMCAFFSSEGEVAIYQGDNPGELETWMLVGVYRIGRPLGPKSMIDAGGDLVIATDIGFIPLSRALDTDFAILGTAAVSEDVIDLWNDEVDLRSNADWNVAFWSRRQMVAVALPTTNDQPTRWLVANAKTKAWSIYSGWDATCLHVFGEQCYFGDSEGSVYLAEVSGLDDGLPYTAVCLPMFDQMGVPGYKTLSMLRAVFRGPNTVDEKVEGRTDYDTTISAPPPATQVIGGATWGDATWGESVWADPGSQKNIFQRWQSAFGGGEVVSPLLQITSGANVPLDAELIRIDGTFTPGEVVV